MRSTRLRLLVPVAALVIAAGCESQKSSNPLSPTIAGPIPGVEISTPKLLEPGQGVKFKANQQPITLLIENAWTTGVRPLRYQFDVAVDAAFQTIVFTKRDVQPGDGGRTSLKLPDKLEVGRTYYWRAYAYDGANTGPLASAASFDVYPPVVISPPALISPVGGAVQSTRRPELRIQNSVRSGPAGNIGYQFQMAKDQAFTQMVADIRQPESGSGQTAWMPGSDLEQDKTHYWRVYATDGENSSGWSATQSFKTPKVAPEPGPAPGAPCNNSTPFGIVQCRRAQYGTPMSASQLVTMLKSVAADLNAGAFPDRPYGILRKASGTSCNGYSCDIICSGQGTSQKQWDVLGDADPGSGTQVPTWNGPATYPNIRIDTCEIQ